MITVIDNLMMNKGLKILLLALILIGCKQPFESPVRQLSKDVLCIEGFINTGGEVSIITLSKLQDLKDSIMQPELKAKVLLEEENGGSMALTETGKGIYTLDPRTYDTSKRYRMSITRNNGKQYQSEFVKINIAPPIDRLSYKVKDSSGITILLDTHDAIAAPRYYYWEYEETWEFGVPIPSQYYYSDKDKAFLKRTQSVEYCYRTEISNKLVLGTTINLADNITKDQEITFASQRSGRIAKTYSINVKQHAIDKGYFEYLQKMKKNTEDIGSIFDVQPTQNTTNFTSLADAKETVIGYFNMHTVQQKRIFIKANELPQFPPIHWNECVITTYDFWYAPKGGGAPIYLYPEEYFTDPKKFVPIVYTKRNPDLLSTVSGAIASCGDCTINGSITKPSFWPY